jgi:hypothetical protein
MSEPTSPSPEALRAWAAYGRERFDALDAQLREFRAWARQLITAIGLIVGLELTLVAKIAFDVRPTVSLLWWVSLAGFLGTTIYQVRILFNVLDIGYVSKELPSPGKPSALWSEIANGEDAIIQEIGVHYANSYDTLRTLSNDLADRLSAQTRRFGYSLAAFCIAVALCGILAFATARQPSQPTTQSTTPTEEAPNTTERRQAMPTDKKPQSPAATIPQTPSATPAVTPAAPAKQATAPASTMPAPRVPLENGRFSAQPAETPPLPRQRVAQDALLKLQTAKPVAPGKKKG